MMWVAVLLSLLLVMALNRSVFTSLGMAKSARILLIWAVIIVLAVVVLRWVGVA